MKRPLSIRVAISIWVLFSFQSWGQSRPVVRRQSRLCKLNGTKSLALPEAKARSLSMAIPDTMRFLRNLRRSIPESRLSTLPAKGDPILSPVS